MLVEILGTWPAIAGTGEGGDQRKEEGLNMRKEKLRRFTIKETI